MHPIPKASPSAMAFVGAALPRLSQQTCRGFPCSISSPRFVLRPLSALRMQQSERRFPRREAWLKVMFLSLSALGGQMSFSKQAMANSQPDAATQFAVDPSGFRFESLKDGYVVAFIL